MPWQFYRLSLLSLLKMIVGHLDREKAEWNKIAHIAAPSYGLEPRVFMSRLGFVNESPVDVQTAREEAYAILDLFKRQGRVTGVA